VDDETGIVSIADKILSSLGYRMATFTCSVEALDAFKTTPGKYDLIITDQTMPRMTGADLARKVLEIRPEIPVIICTGFSRSISEAEAQDIGIKGLLMKPFTLQSLSKAVHSAL
jgi:CheY-like chemotaxis protein